MPVDGPRVFRPLPPLLALPMVAMSVLVMAYSGLTGPLGILLFYGLWLPLMVTRGIAVAAPPTGGRWAMAYLALCCASILWSDYRDVTLRAAFELGTMLACSFIMVRLVPTDAYVKGLILGVGAVLLASLANGSYGVDAFGGAPTLIGLFGSKNQLGFFAELGVFLAVVFCLCRGTWLRRLAWGLPVLALSVLCLARSHSASSLASLALTLAVVGAVWAIAGFTSRLRAGLMIAAGLALPLMLVAGASFGLQDAILEAFGKDATLTGRTYLWAQGYAIGLRHLALGIGYAAFWVQGRPEAEYFWHRFYIQSRTGFHFHDTYVEVFVELGLAGLLAVALWLGASLVRSLRAVALFGWHLDCILPLGLSVLLVVRSFVEVDVLGPFGMGLFLLLAILPRLAQFETERASRHVETAPAQAG